MGHLVEPPGMFAVGGGIVLVAGLLLAGAEAVPAGTLAFGGLLLLITQVGLVVQSMGS